MQVTSVGWQDKEVISEKRRYPYTFFSLNQAEQQRYRAFCEEHSQLELCIKELQEVERLRREEKIQSLFLEIVKPYLDICQLEVAECFAGYGKEKEIYVKTPYSALFKDEDPFDLVFRTTCWFERAKEANTLSCRSSLGYQSRTQKSWLRTGIIDDITRSIIEEESKRQNTFLVDSQYGGFNFAPVDVAMPLMVALGKILRKIGVENFKEAYRQKLQEILKAVGLFDNRPSSN